MTQIKKTFLFLDDDAFHVEKIRNPEVYYPLIGAHEILKIADASQVEKFITVEDAIKYVEEKGCPDFISFDNDLKQELEGIHFAHWLVDKDLDNPGFIPEDFKFFVHSQNIIAKDRIYSYLNQYLENKEKQIDTQKRKKFEI